MTRDGLKQIPGLALSTAASYSRLAASVVLSTCAEVCTGEFANLSLQEVNLTAMEPVVFIFRGYKCFSAGIESKRDSS